MLDAEYDIVIIGAGPAGSSCAIALDHRWKVLLIDKASFPRDKVCGDAIPGAGIKALIPYLGSDWYEKITCQKIYSSTIVSTRQKELTVEWSGVALNATRMEFDHYLWKMACAQSNITFHQNSILQVKKNDGEFHLIQKDGPLIRTKMLIGCDGPGSIVRRDLMKETLAPVDAAALRVYYEGLKLPIEQNYFIMNPKVPDSYTWIFPVGNNIYNVGFGVLKSRSKTDIKKLFSACIEESPFVKKVLETGTIVQGVKGHRLPVYESHEVLGGENFALCGDAAHLVDPLQGHGIDKAIISGIELAQLINREHQLDGSKYAQIIHRKLGRELKRNWKLMIMIQKAPWLIDWAIKLNKYSFIKNQIKKLT